jgi:beta-lactamase superfamily II metal-dependent hydrolase
VSPEPVSVRMYNVGFGDCFLLRLPTSEGVRTMLFDCGVHSASQSSFSLEQIIGAVIEDVTDAEGVPRIDIVVMSHRHQDHVKGFEDNRWNTVHVGEVWMPWTENPDDPVARSLLERQSGGALRLVGLAAAGTPAQLVAMNSLTNEKAMATLHRGFAGPAARRFLPAMDSPDQDEVGQPQFPSVQSARINGVSIRVLGPSRDERVIRNMDPPSGEAYVTLPKAELAQSGEALPFDRWRLDQSTFRNTAEYKHLDRWGLGDVVKAGREDPYVLAVALEQAVNNTSLMLLIEVGAACLFFAGDAQWGSWERIINHPRGQQLLDRTTFYKVGHHGSHNATPRAFVERHLHGAAAMVSVAPTAIPSWKNIPKRELLQELSKEGRCRFVVNSADPTASAEVSVERDGLSVEIRVPT